VVSVAGAQSMLAAVRFYPDGYSVNSGNYGEAGTDRGGRTPAQSGGSIPIVTVGGRPSNYATIDKFAYGLDTAGVFYTWAQASADTLVISPISHLMVSSNTESKLETQLGINGSVFGLQTNRDLKTFSATDAITSTDPEIAADGERLLAHHLRIHLLNAALANFGPREPDPTGIGDFLPTQSYVTNFTLANYLASASATFIYTNANMVTLLNSFPGISGANYRADVMSAAAHLINAYAAAIGVRISSREQAARFMIGIKGYLVPELNRLLAANDAANATRVLAVTTSSILAETARYTEQAPFDINDSYFPSPDFYTLAPGGSKLVDATDVGSNGDGPFTSNDLHLRPTPTQGPFFRGISMITAVNVPAINAGQVAATLNPDGTVLIRALAGFSGVTWFDYTTRHDQGDIEMGRVYVRVWG
jgi:hypothetical protein